MKNTVEMYTPELLMDSQLLLSHQAISANRPGFSYESLSLKKEFVKKGSAYKEEPGKKDHSFRNIMELPVNNFLKTFKEIEAEFYYVFNSIKSAITEIPDSLDSFGRMMKKTE